MNVRWFALLLAILLIASSRFLFLDADPGLIKSLLANAGDSGDEGYWSFPARNLLLYKQVITDDFTHVFISPFYTVIAYIFYEIFGLSMWTTRLPVALFGTLSVFLVHQLIRKYDQKGAIIAALVLAVENLFFTYTRMGHPETIVGFFVLVSFYLLLVTEKPILAGVAYGLSVASKISAIWAGPAFVLFFFLQWCRGEMKRREVFRFIAGGMVIGVCYLALLSYYHDLFLRNLLSVESQGIKFFRSPARAVLDVMIGLYTAYPSVALLLVLLGVYVSRIEAVRLLGLEGKERLRQLNAAEIVTLSWLLGYTFSMIFISDGHHRRMNLFAIPLAMIPGLLARFKKRDAAQKEPAKAALDDFSSLQTFVVFFPATMLAILVVKQALSHIYLVAVVFLSGAVMFSRRYHRLPSFWKEHLQKVPFMAWVALSAAPLAMSFLRRISPNSGIDLSVLGKASIILVWVAFVYAFALLATRRTGIAIVFMILVNLLLDGYDLSHRTYSVRDAANYLSGITTSRDYITGGGAFSFSLNARYRPVLWYPSVGVNTQYVKDKKPGYFLVETKRGLLSGRPYESIPTTADLDAVGVKRIELLKEFELYFFPLGGRPTYTMALYRLFY